MNATKTLRLSIALAAMAWLISEPELRAQSSQEGVAYQSPEVPQDPNLAKVTMVRLWYTGDSTAAPISLVKGTPGEKPSLIEGGINCGVFSPYVPMRPGRLKLYIMNGSASVSESATEKTLEKEALAPPLDINLVGGKYVTVVINSMNGTLTGNFFQDKRPDGETSVLRAVNLTAQDGWTIELVNSADQLKETLAKIAASEIADNIAFTPSGIVRLRVFRKSGGLTEEKGVFEADIKKGTPFSIVLYPAGTNGSAAQMVFDAAPGPFYNQALVEQIASGKSPAQQ